MRSFFAAMSCVGTSPGAARPTRRRLQQAAQHLPVGPRVHALEPLHEARRCPRGGPGPAARPQRATDRVRQPRARRDPGRPAPATGTSGVQAWKALGQGAAPRGTGTSARLPGSGEAGAAGDERHGGHQLGPPPVQLQQHPHAHGEGRRGAGAARHREPSSSSVTRSRSSTWTRRRVVPAGATPRCRRGPGSPSAPPGGPAPGRATM